MQLHLSTWADVDAYLTAESGIVIPIGSTEQHGPTGLIGTDALCPEIIAKAAGDKAGIMVGPTFNVGIAQHHMAFSGTVSLRPSTMIAAMSDWAASFARHGFRHLYWLNGHGGNIATINAAFAEIYGARSLSAGGENRPGLDCRLVNWWDLPNVRRLRETLFGDAEGSHATPSEISVTYAAYPDAAREATFEPRVAPRGRFTDAEDFRRRFPDGRIGSDPALASAEKGEQLIAAAADDLIADYRSFCAG